MKIFKWHIISIDEYDSRIENAQREAFKEAFKKGRDFEFQTINDHKTKLQV